MPQNLFEMQYWDPHLSEDSQHSQMFKGSFICCKLGDPQLQAYLKKCKSKISQGLMKLQPIFRFHFAYCGNVAQKRTEQHSQPTIKKRDWRRQVCAIHPVFLSPLLSALLSISTLIIFAASIRRSSSAERLPPRLCLTHAQQCCRA